MQCFVCIVFLKPTLSLFASADGNRESLHFLWAANRVRDCQALKFITVQSSTVDSCNLSQVGRLGGCHLSCAGFVSFSAVICKLDKWASAQ